MTTLVKLQMAAAAGLAACSLCLVHAAPAAAACQGCQAAALANETIYNELAVNAGNFSVTGVVQGVSYSQNVIEVLAAGVKESIHITPTTSIEKHGETGSIADLRPGVHVVITGVVRDSQRVAVTIEIK